MGVACSLDTLVVSTCSRVEKKVERSGRRGGREEGAEGDGVGTLCSTEGGKGGLVVAVKGGWGRERGTFVGSHF